MLWWKQQVSFKYSIETLLGAAIQDGYNKLQRVNGEKILTRAISILRITLFWFVYSCMLILFYCRYFTVHWLHHTSSFKQTNYEFGYEWLGVGYFITYLKLVSRYSKRYITISMPKCMLMLNSIMKGSQDFFIVLRLCMQSYSTDCHLAFFLRNAYQYVVIISFKYDDPFWGIPVKLLYIYFSFKIVLKLSLLLILD